MELEGAVRGWRDLDLEVSRSVVMSFQINAVVRVVEYVVFNIYIVGIVP